MKQMHKLFHLINCRDNFKYQSLELWHFLKKGLGQDPPWTQDK
jgi:hypothetical protein